MTDLAALIEKLEQAEGPLDPGGVAMVIAAARGTFVRKFSIHTGDCGEDEMLIEFADGTKGNFSENDWPDRSLDAALTLVKPEDWVALRHRRNESGNRVCGASLEVGAPNYLAAGIAATFPLALCIAALKARSAT